MDSNEFYEMSKSTLIATTLANEILAYLLLILQATTSRAPVAGLHHVWLIPSQKKKINPKLWQPEVSSYPKPWENRGI